MAEDIIEKIPIEIFPDEGNHIAIKIAKIIFDKINENNALGKKTVLGLATGNTPLNIYRELVRLHNEDNLDFSNVITFNLDEYYGLNPEHINSYHRFMWENLFEHINIKKENVHIPNGTIKENEIGSYCYAYEKEIKDAGGVDMQILGIGRDGHIGFNEPGSSADSRTRLVVLDDVTRTDALPDFGEKRYVPKRAISMGVATILEARQIIMIATGEHKAHIIYEAAEGPINEKVAASYLQRHQNAKIFLDRAAASELTRIKTPWVFDNINWDDKNIRVKAICYLSEHMQKPITELEASDFLKNSLGSLIKKYPLLKLGEEVFHELESKIKDSEKLPQKKKILVFSPHPDDDIISMGGTLKKLVKNSNEINVIYMTPGYTAVFDHAVINFITARKRFAKSFNIDDPYNGLYQKVMDFLHEKRKADHGMVDSPEVLEIKKIIREVEAISACNFMDIEGCEFLKLPFYQTGRARKMPIGEQDIKIVKETIEKYNPDIIYAAGDLTDPNGTHRLCLNAVCSALERMQKTPELWLYSGAWNEFPPAESDVLVPLNAEEVDLKRIGIFRHESQKDKAPQPGHIKMEFWQMAEKRNASTAKLLETYGIKGYAAIEAFKINKD